MVVSLWRIPTGDLPSWPLPPGVRPWVVRRRATLVTFWVDYRPGGVLAYREFLIALAVRHGHRPAASTVAAWVDDDRALAGGRALWGIPKEQGTITFRADSRSARAERLAAHGRNAGRGRGLPAAAGGARVVYRNGRLDYRHDEATTLQWPFPEPLGSREVIGEFTMADVVTVPSHLAVPEVRTYMTAEAARDVSAPGTPAPEAVDEHGRSDQTFLVDVVVRSGGSERRAVARGQDIYAVTAPLAVEALHRILTGRTRTVGVVSAGEIFDAADFLRALSSHLSVELPR